MTESQSKRSVPGIRALLDRVRIACDVQGLPYDDKIKEAARTVIDNHVNNLSGRLGITPAGWMATYKQLLNDEWIAEVARQAVRVANDPRRFQGKDLMVMPYGMVTDWFLDGIENEEDDGLKPSQRKLTLNLSKLVTDELVRYMRDNDIVFATPTPKTGKR